MSNLQELTESVNRGAAFMDEHFLTIRPGGPNWFEIVNVDTLNLNSWIECIIGQSFGVEFSPEYTVAADSLRNATEETSGMLREDFEIRFGFFPVFFSNEEDYHFFAPRTHNALWVEAINARRNRPEA